MLGRCQIPRGHRNFYYPIFLKGRLSDRGVWVRKLPSSKVGITVYGGGPANSQTWAWGRVGRVPCEFFPGTPLVSRWSPQRSSANFVNEELWDQIGGNATAVLTMLCGRTRPTIVVRCVRGNITQAIAINRFGGNFGGILEFSK